MNSVTLGRFQKTPIFSINEEKSLIPKPWFKNVTYTACEKTWSYLGKIVLITRFFLNAAARNIQVLTLTGKQFSENVKEISTRMKLLSIISVPFSLGDMQTALKKMFNSLLLHDKEGTVLSTLSFTVIAADAFDSFTTFINATLLISCMKPIELFSAMGLPLGYAMSGGGTVSRTIQIVKTRNLYQKIIQDILTNRDLDKEKLIDFLEKTLGIDQDLKLLISISQDQQTETLTNIIQRLKDRNRAAILRAAPSGAINELEDLLAKLEHTSVTLSNEELTEILKKFQIVQQHLIKKTEVDGISIVANLFSLIALTLFGMGFTSSLPFALLGVSFATRLGALYHLEHTNASFG